jgi:hypothetical protein
MKTSRLKVLLFFVLGIVGMLVLPDVAKRILSIDLLPDGTIFLMANRAMYALFVAVLAVLLLRGASKIFAISVIMGVTVLIPFLVATATLAIVAGPTWSESAWTTGLAMFSELLLFGLIPIGCWLAWGRSKLRAA